MDDFSGYEKMPTSLKKLGLNESDYSMLDKFKWVVTEKIHGANFSFIYQDRTLRYAKRKEYLSWNDDFFGFQLVAVKVENQITELFEQLSAAIEGDKFIIYGELFGGEYPHPDVPQDNNVQAIQTGVYYSPTIEFCAFDIAIEKDGEKYYLDYESALTYFVKNEITHAKPLLVGKFGDALNFNIRINSAIPKELNLPELTENLIEGVVVKPFNQTDTNVLSSRPIVKLKNPEFDEEKKFHQARKWTYIPKVSSKSEELSFIVEELRNYVTTNRLESAISKIGSLDHDNSSRMKAIEDEFLNDTITDFDENNDGLLNELTAEQRGWIKLRIGADIAELISNQK